MKVVEHEVTCRMKIFHLMEAPLESFPFFFRKITPLNSVKLSRFNFNQGVKKGENCARQYRSTVSISRSPRGNYNFYTRSEAVAVRITSANRSMDRCNADG